jgi:hypothetical protein
MQVISILATLPFALLSTVFAVSAVHNDFDPFRALASAAFGYVASYVLIVCKDIQQFED